MRYSRRRETSWTLRLTDWILEDPDGYEAARAARRRLGRLPRRAQGARVLFNSDQDIKTYDGLPAKALARIAQHICGAAGDENGLLWALRGITRSVIAPLLAYMRVNFALARLAVAIGEQPPPSERHDPPSTQNYPGEDDLAPPVLAVRSGAPQPRPKTAARHMIKTPPTFTWAQTPRAIYGFEALQAQWGYDPRGTSVHWIEKRAARLRAAWQRHHSGVAPPPPPPHPPVAPVPEPEPEPAPTPTPVRHFVPVDADYNTIWPPVELPKAPPKVKAVLQTGGAGQGESLESRARASQGAGSGAGMTEREDPAASRTAAIAKSPAADIFAAFAAIGFHAIGDAGTHNFVSAAKSPESGEPQALPGTGLLKWSVQKTYQPPPPPPPPPPPEKPPPPDVPEL